MFCRTRKQTHAQNVARALTALTSADADASPAAAAPDDIVKAEGQRISAGRMPSKARFERLVWNSAKTERIALAS